MVYVRSLGRLFSRGDHFQLHAVHAVHAVDEQDEDEDKGDFEPVHDLGDDGVFGDEAAGEVSGCSAISGGTNVRKDLALGRVRERDEEEHKEHHLQDEEEEDLSACQLEPRMRARQRRTYERVVERHGGRVICCDSGA